jgi:hypothetical protein
MIASTIFVDVPLAPWTPLCNLLHHLLRLQLLFFLPSRNPSIIFRTCFIFMPWYVVIEASNESARTANNDWLFGLVTGMFLPKRAAGP